MADYTPGALTALFGGSAKSTSDVVSKKKNPLFEKKVKSVFEELGDAATKHVSQPSASDEAKPKPRSSTRKGQSYAKQMTEEEKERTVFVGNVPIDMSRKALKKLFSSCGPVETVRLRSAVPRKLHMPKKAAVIRREMAEVRETLNAYVKFRTQESTEAALQMNGTMLNGRHLQVDSCTSSKRYDEKRTVFLGNLPYDAEEECLYEQFSDCGNIEKVRLVRDRATGKGKGFGFVVFKDPTSVSFALKLNGEQFANRELRITRVEKKRKLTGNASAANAMFGNKKRRKDNDHHRTPNRQLNASRSPVASNNKPQPSKRIRDLIQKRKSKQRKKSYMSTH